MEKGKHYVTIENGNIILVTEEVKTIYTKIKSLHQDINADYLIEKIKLALENKKFYRVALWVSFKEEYAVNYFETISEAKKAQLLQKNSSTIKTLSGYELIDANYSYFFLYPEEIVKAI